MTERDKHTDVDELMPPPAWAEQEAADVDEQQD